MAQYITRGMIIQFLLGFLIGKFIGAIVSTTPYFYMLFDSALSGLFFSEFTANILAFNGYHYALAIIGGLILAIWKSNDLFE